jgi:hypothetical protein
MKAEKHWKSSTRAPERGLETGKNAGCGTWGHAARPASGFLAAGFYDPGRGRKRREKSTD